MATAEKVDTLKELLRGEIAAVETYQQAMEKIGSDPGAAELRQIHDEHRDTANSLRLHIRDHNGTPDHGSGAWGAWAKVVTGVAKLFGNTAAVKALKEGEEHGIKSYEKALEDKELPEECKELMRSRLLPQTRAHLLILDRLLAGK
jgi:uncharacterized protein (TIGR02284 family)